MKVDSAKIFLQVPFLIYRGWPYGRPEFLVKTPPKQTAEARDSPSRPRARQRLGDRIRIRVRSGVGLDWTDAQDRT